MRTRRLIFGLLGVWCLIEFLDNARIEVVSLNGFLKLPTVDDLFATGSHVRLNHQHAVDQALEVPRVGGGWVLVDTFNYLLIQGVHVGCSERWVESKRLIQDAPQAPDVALCVVRGVVPYLRTRIVGRSRLRVQKSFFCDLRNIKVTEQSHAVFGEEDVRTFDVPVEDV